MSGLLSGPEIGLVDSLSYGRFGGCYSGRKKLGQLPKKQFAANKEGDRDGSLPPFSNDQPAGGHRAFRPGSSPAG
jgi:hypothetical protein